MAAPSVDKISNGKPVVTGGVLNGPLGATVPTDATTAIDPSIKALGYVSEDGLQPEGERSTNTVRDWAGDVIAQLQTEHSSRFTFTLYGVFDEDVLKAVFGSDAVTVTPATETTGTLFEVVETGDELPHSTWVFDVRGTSGKKTRIVIPDGQPSSVTEGPLVAGELQSFTLTVEAFKDEAGVKAYRFYDDGVFATAP